MPHSTTDARFRQALRMATRMPARDDVARPALALALFDEIACGLIACGGNGRVSHANCAARAGRYDDRLLASVLPLEMLSTDCPLVLVMLGQRRPCSVLGLRMLAPAYGLASAERRVLRDLMREATPQEIAAENQVALSTVRTQISALRPSLRRSPPRQACAPAIA